MLVTICKLARIMLQVKDMLPDLGQGFVIDCLKYYKLDPEAVVNAILEENLPPFLSDCDRSAAKSIEIKPPCSFDSEETSTNCEYGRNIPSSEIFGSKMFKNDVREKIHCMSPLNLFYNKVKHSPQTHRDKRSLYFTDLLHPSLGNLESSLQINFMVDYEWLLLNYEVTSNLHKPLTIIYGEANELADKNSPLKSNIIAKRVKPRYPYGTHHTKMMVLVYDDSSVRVVVHTSNLIASDWENRTQGLWVSPRCPKLENTTNSSTRWESIGDSKTCFKRSLLRYLNFYEVSVLRPFTEKIKVCDFSSVNAFFVGSVPGSHVISPSDPFQNWGHAFVAKILCKHNEHNKEMGYRDEESDIILQCSSIGSLGPNIEGSFLMELSASLNATTLRSTKKLPKWVRLVYPSKENVLNAYGGPLYGSGCLPYSQKTSDKQPWLNKVMCKWESDLINRTKAMPHIKTYTKLNGFCAHTKTDKERPKASYFILTSANLSKSAWGSLNKTEDKLFIQSYEAGILLLPKFTHGESHYSYSVTAESVDKPAELVLPYDLPLTEHDSNDVPWVSECLTDYI